MGRIPGTRPSTSRFGCRLRREEILALRWGNVDLESGTLEVRRALTYAAGQLHLGAPKSRAGQWVLALPGFVARARRRHRASQAERLLAIGIAAGDGTLVVDDGIGRPWMPPSFSTTWRRFARRHGFDVTFHGLRHGAATLLLAAGVSDAVAASVLGHADTRILRRYQEVVDELRRDAAARRDRLLGEVGSGP